MEREAGSGCVGGSRLGGGEGRWLAGELWWRCVKGTRIGCGRRLRRGSQVCAGRGNWDSGGGRNFGQARVEGYKVGTKYRGGGVEGRPECMARRYKWELRWGKSESEGMGGGTGWRCGNGSSLKV